KVLQKKSKKGKKFFGCEDNPTCGFMSWNTPVTDVCPKCNSTLFKKGGKAGMLICEKPDCGYERSLKDE
ncbi:MAG: topoisomerase DNA-binding C4 zinc finger domain-containing protein, partial [Oscillospiraceae bacterium]